MTPDSEEWPFSEPKSTPVYTTKRVVYRRFPVLLVEHPEAGIWQFLDGHPVTREDGALVSLEYLVSQDPELSELADLPEGWKASRAATGFAWERAEIYA